MKTTECPGTPHQGHYAGDHCFLDDPEFVEPDHLQREIFHKWKGGQIEERIISARLTIDHLRDRMDEAKQVGSVASLNFAIERSERELIMLSAWQNEEEEHEANARHQRLMRQHEQEDERYAKGPGAPLTQDVADQAWRMARGEQK